MRVVDFMAPLASLSTTVYIIMISRTIDNSTPLEKSFVTPPSLPFPASLAGGFFNFSRLKFSYLPQKKKWDCPSSADYPTSLLFLDSDTAEKEAKWDSLLKEGGGEIGYGRGEA